MDDGLNPINVFANAVRDASARDAVEAFEAFTLSAKKFSAELQLGQTPNWDKPTGIKLPKYIPREYRMHGYRVIC